MPSPLWDSRGTSDPRGEEVFDWVISSDLLPLNDPDTPTLLHRSSGSRSSPDISFSPSSLALSCSWEVLQDLGSDHLPILLSISLSPVFRPNERPPSFNFQKARWDGFASCFDSHCPSAEEYSSLSLSSAAALFTSLTLNVAKSSIPFGASNALLKPGGLLRWKKRLVKDARLSLPLTEVMKIARLTSPLLDAPPQSSSRPRLRHGRRFALLFHLSLTLNLYTLFFALSLAHLPRLPLLLTFLTVLLPGNRLRSMPLPEISLIRFSARGYLSELRRAMCSEESYSSFCSLFSLAEFLAAASNLSSSSATGPDKVAYPILKQFSRSGKDFLLYVFNLLVFALLSFHLEDIFYYFHTQDGNASRLSCFLPAYLSHLLRIKAF